MEYIAFFVFIMSTTYTFYTQFKINPAMELITQKLTPLGMFAINGATVTLQYWFFFQYMEWHAVVVVLCTLGIAWNYFQLRQHEQSKVAQASMRDHLDALNKLYPTT